jgi:hypothetical protein
MEVAKQVARRVVKLLNKLLENRLTEMALERREMVDRDHVLIGGVMKPFKIL